MQEAMDRLTRAALRVKAERDQLLDIAKRLALLTDEGDDWMHGVYVDADLRARAKGSTLGLIEDARAAIARAEAE